MAIAFKNGTKEIEEILSMCKNPSKTAHKMPEEDYLRAVTYLESRIPNVKKWESTLWNPLYGLMTDIIYYRCINTGRDDLTQQEKRIVNFETVARLSKKYLILPKDRWFSKAAGKDTDMPPEQARKWAVKAIRELRDSEPFDPSMY
jgi:hypothetical protein